MYTVSTLSCCNVYTSKLGSEVPMVLGKLRAFCHVQLRSTTQSACWRGCVVSDPMCLLCFACLCPVFNHLCFCWSSKCIRQCQACQCQRGGFLHGWPVAAVCQVCILLLRTHLQPFCNAFDLSYACSSMQQDVGETSLH